MFRYLPEQASEVAPKVDWLNYLILDLSLFFTVAIVGAMLYFAIKYRARNGVHHDTPRIEGSHFLEGVWTLIPTVICIIIAVYGVKVFRDLRAVPGDALTINVSASKWRWDFQYANGKQTVNEAVVPVDTPIKFVIEGKDVLHSLFIPAMRVKSDAVPGRYTYVSFKPVKTGEYHVFCTEYCGTNHSGMYAKLRVVPKNEYDRWLEDNGEQIKYKPAEIGRNVYFESCKVCHSLDGSKVVGPSFLNIYNKKGKLADGSEYTADENYLKESILNPNAKIVEGFNHPSPMPSFAGSLDDKIDAVIAFLKTVDGKGQASSEPAPQFNFSKAGDGASDTPAGRGKALYTAKACNGCHSLDGTAIAAPSFKGLFGKSESLVDGSQAAVDEAYIKESIVNPNAKVVKGFSPGAMPGNYKDLLSEQEVSDIVEFIKSVK